MAKLEAVNHPQHYNQGKFEVIDVIDDWGLNFALGNTVKYIARAPHKKKPIEDLRKAAWYLDYQITTIDRPIKMLELMMEQISDAATMGEIDDVQIKDLYNWLGLQLNLPPNETYHAPEWYLNFMRDSQMFDRFRLRSGTPAATRVVNRAKRLEIHSGAVIDYIMKNAPVTQKQMRRQFPRISPVDLRELISIFSKYGFVSIERATTTGNMKSVGIANEEETLYYGKN